MRSFAKTAMSCGLSWSRADRLFGALASAREHAVIVGYHRVVEDFDTEAARAIPAMLTSRSMFERQLDWIGQRFRFASLDEIGRRFAGDEEGDEPLAAVTFDDGYRDTYEEAFPILKRKGIPAAVFLVTDLVGTGQLQVHDRLFLVMRRAFARWPDAARALGSLLADLGIALPDSDRLHDAASTPHGAVVLLLRRLRQHDVDRVAAAVEERIGPEPGAPGMAPLDWDMVAEMHRAGVLVGSHTRSHACLTREDPGDAAEQLRGSRQEIERRLGVSPVHFCYPDGRFDRGTVDGVAAAGYRFGYTTCTHRDPMHPLLTLPRLLLWENACLDGQGRFSPAVMSCQVHGVWMRLANECHQAHAA